MTSNPPKTADELREAFLSYFEGHDHLRMPSASLIPAADPTLLLINSGMAQFKPYFSGEKEPPHPRVTTSQKCFRTTDIEEVGDDTHLTMFEMLGNFSFGNYFKKEACAWALDLLTNKFGLDPERLYYTVYTTDDEAENIWKELGIPADRIYRFGHEDNWWGPAGDEGVCGPSSEINYYRGSLDDVPAVDDPIRNGEWGPNYHDDFVELYNLVFTQFYRDLDGNDTVLPAKNIDTGMGFERMLAVLQGAPNVYETDAFRPIIAHVEQLSGKEWGQDTETDRAIRVVAEHSRSASFLIGDGVIPGNSGRGYVLRRLIRRGMLFGRELGVDTTMLSVVAKTVSDHMGHAYPELVGNYEFIKDVLEQEENSFSRTLEFGALVLAGMIHYRSENPDAAERIKDGKSLKTPAGDDGKSVGTRLAIAELERLVEAGNSDDIDEWRNIVSGTEAFVLYDTYGYPVEVTEEVAGEAELSVDRTGFEFAMETQRERGRAAGGFGGNADSTRVYEELGVEDTPFVGYETLVSETSIVAIVKDGQPVDSASEGDEVELILGETPFYAARGGQVGDTGSVVGEGVEISITDTLAPYGHVNVHYGTVTSGSLTKGAQVTATVDGDRRERIRRNHTATHLIHAALREIVGSHVRQAGSVVDPDRLRFDFTNMQALTRDQIKAVQDRVNEKIRLNRDVEVHWSTYGEAVEEGALAFFGDTYDNEVRTIKIDAPWSYELCGGTHMDHTGGIGTFVITSETGIGSGMRRLEAITGVASEEAIFERFGALDDIASKFRVPVSDASDRVDALANDLAQARKQVEQLEEQLLQASVGGGGANGSSNSFDIEVDGTSIHVEVSEVPASNVGALRKTGDHLKNQIGKGVVVLGSVIDGRPMVVVMATDDTVKAGVHSGNVARAIASRMGGGGGGSPAVAQAGGKNADQLQDALGATEEIIRESLNGGAGS
ncbi:alanine--tRNA ligase [Candidatus Lucifugimonas marina]|uniref:Alanine--tRNA ligase n=1 Tax=Candidatus Lucifugimonas marina TaxID=3038979 RepID=A0AAJ5ZE91_9CHLR|nr:alanine--tRNA ligase [SAR202 cluster bacterium JH702]MDG0868776.1 alanine--tRNA ligase [SAR202 cluster bacterium JH639]WFG35408.1 alanine--tRNA ligase [SAR202 cluster bacterium JH545]WFG39355.1 alanine--tRNA ligase [SAR202 cluster bacterium JH1073]